jgi:hypothetical protein
MSREQDERSSRPIERHVDPCGLDTSLTGPPNNAIPLPTPSNDALSSNWWARPPRLRSTKSACSAGCGKLAWALAPRPLWATQFFLQIAIRRRADERTRTADLISLRVITQALQGCAGGCKCRIFRRSCLLRGVTCCTVSRSRWCQCSPCTCTTPSSTSCSCRSTSLPGHAHLYPSPTEGCDCSAVGLRKIMQVVVAWP